MHSINNYNQKTKPQLKLSTSEEIQSVRVDWLVVEKIFEKLNDIIEQRLLETWELRVVIKRRPSVSVRLEREVSDTRATALVGLLGCAHSTESGAVCADRELVLAFAQFVLGDRSARAAQVVARDLTPFECTLFQPLVCQVLDSVAEAFAPVGALSLRHEGWDMAGPLDDCPALALPLTIGMCGVEGQLVLLLPLSFLAPINGALGGVFRGFGDSSVDQWPRVLGAHLALATAAIRVVLHEQALPFGTLQRLQIAETLVFDAPAEPLVTLCVDDIPVGKGRLGRAGQSIAVRLETRISTQKEAGNEL